MESNIVVALIGGIGGVLGALVVGLFQRRKTGAETNKLQADANEVIRTTVMALINPLKTRIVELERRVDFLEGRATRYLARIAYLMDGNCRLTEQLERNGIVPIWRPDEWRPDEDEQGILS
jgi:hypothetical protein